MKVKSIVQKTAKKLVNGTLPDIDTDFAGKDRAYVKSYMENRFGKSQVCSVGSFTTMKLKGLVKDLARINGVDFSEANLITSVIDNNASTMYDLFEIAQREPKLKHFIKNNSDIFHMLPTLLNQPKTKSIHPCAVIVFPSVMTVNEWCPVRTQSGMVVSEWGGGEMDDAGFLKDDILAIKQLDKFTDILKLIGDNGKEVPDIYDLPHDNEVYRYFSNGWNGDVFQMGSEGLTEYTKSLRPQSLDDLVAAVALYRPAAMENHYHEIYVKCKNEGRQPTYLWGTEKIAKDTFGLLIYQEQVMMVFQELGGLTMKEADDVRRAMGKKKLSVLLPWKDRVEKGFFERGATQDEFESVWTAVLEFAKYGFNKSHSACYALTGYVCQYLKVNYPIEYWTVALDYASEENTLRFLSEIIQSKTISLESPNINKSLINMTSSQEDKSIYWGIESIKGIGETSAEQIIYKRNEFGDYTSLEDFVRRNTFKGSKVNKTTCESLISCGAFDELAGIKGEENLRADLVKEFRLIKKVKIPASKKDIFASEECGAKWWWHKRQKALTGLSYIDYESIASSYEIKAPFCKVSEINRPQYKDIYRSFGGYVVAVKEGKTKKGKYARITIESNYKIYTVLCWAEQYEDFRSRIKGSEKSLMVFTASVKYDAKWAKGNQFTLSKNSHLIIL